MNKLNAIAATAVAALIALTGCSSDEPAEKPVEPTAQAAEATTPAPTKSAPAEAPATNGMSDDYNMGGEQLNIGDTFRVNKLDAESTIYHWDVKVTGVETVDALPSADDNEEYYSGEDMDASPYVDAKPEPGNEFVHITYEQTNAAGVPTSLTLEASIAFSDGEVFAPLGDDRDYYTVNLTAQNENPAGNEQNHNTTTEGDWVIEVPKGSEVQAVVISDVYMGATEEYWVDLK